MFLGIAVRQTDESHTDIGFCTHDGTYSTDFVVHTLKTEGLKQNMAEAISKFIIPTIRTYQIKHKYKYMGAGISKDTVLLSPTLPAELWKQLDIIPLVIAKGQMSSTIGTLEADMEVDEMADSVVRSCIT